MYDIKVVYKLSMHYSVLYTHNINIIYMLYTLISIILYFVCSCWYYLWQIITRYVTNIQLRNIMIK